MSSNSLHLVLVLLASAVFMVALFRYLNLPSILGYLLVGIVIGGLGGLSGLVFGAIFVAFLPLWTQGEDLGSLLPHWIREEAKKPGGASIIYGVVLILLMFVMPNGVSGVFRRVGQMVGRRGYSRPE